MNIIMYTRGILYKKSYQQEHDKSIFEEIFGKYIWVTYYFSISSFKSNDSHPNFFHKIIIG